MKKIDLSLCFAVMGLSRLVLKIRFSPYLQNTSHLIFHMAVPTLELTVPLKKVPPTHHVRPRKHNSVPYRFRAATA